LREQVIRNIQEEFLGTAFRYLVDSGLENTSIRDLCKAMGISSGSLYYWFDGKDDVYINAVKYGLSKVTASIFDFVFSHIGDDLRNDVFHIDGWLCPGENLACGYFAVF